MPAASGAWEAANRPRPSAEALKFSPVVRMYTTAFLDLPPLLTAGGTLRLLGCDIQQNGDTVHITGLAGKLSVLQADLFMGNAGTAIRPLTAALALLSATQGGVFTLSGVPRMHERPIGDLVDALRPLCCVVECLANEGYPPLRLAGGRLNL